MLNVSSLWRSTPPTIFPICLALLGLGLGWRNASGVLPIAPEIGDVLLGLGIAYYLFFLTSYLGKMFVRPDVLIEDTGAAPGRAAISALAMSMLMLAAILLPYGPVAGYVLWFGVILQIAASSVGAYAILRDPPENRQFSTFQYLTFVGPVIAATAAISLGYVTAVLAVTLAALVAYAAITTGMIRQLLRSLPPKQLRPSMAIFLAPVCLFANSFALMGIDWGFFVFYWISVAIAGGLLVLVPWMAKGGWSPVWSSVTFPIAAFLQVQILAVREFGETVHVFGLYGVLVIGTPVILIIAYRITRMWASGDLAAKSGAARA